MKTIYKDAFDNIVMLAAGADINKFVNIKAGLESLSMLESEGDEAAKKVLKIMIQFSELINILGKGNDKNIKI